MRPAGRDFGGHKCTPMKVPDDPGSTGFSAGCYAGGDPSTVWSVPPFWPNLK
jgi:hypothetical protein